MALIKKQFENVKIQKWSVFLTNKWDGIYIISYAAVCNSNLFRIKRFMLDEMTLGNVSKFAGILVYGSTLNFLSN